MNSKLAPPVKNKAWYPLPSNPNSSIASALTSSITATKSLLLCDISKMDKPELLKFKIASADFSKTSCGKIQGPAL